MRKKSCKRKKKKKYKSQNSNQLNVRTETSFPGSLKSKIVILRASERKISRRYEGRYRAPKSYWAPKPYRGPCR